MIGWDAWKRLRNLAGHGIDFEDLEPFFEGDLLTREETREAYGEPRLQSIGLCNGAILFVAWTPRGTDGRKAHIISARKAQKHETQAWLERYAKR